VALDATGRDDVAISKRIFSTMTLPASTPWRGFREWVGNIIHVVITVLNALEVTIRTWFVTYHPDRKTFTEHFEYPELPLVVADRFRGFHRFDLTTCIGCERCAKDCPISCIRIAKERAEGRKGFRVTSYEIDYGQCMFCGICTESCPVDCIFMGSTHDLSGYTRDGCRVDFTRLPLEIAWGRTTLNPTAVAHSKRVANPVCDGPGA
jgi:NADH-quinone oxidoreductase subunit I